jgi:hypothetical protein
MHDFTHKNGVTEQTRWLRQQPRHMRHVPFDFEVQAELKRRAFIDGVVAWLGIVGLVCLWIIYS